MSSLTTDLENRLKQGGWKLIRVGKHRTWEHPNGAVHSVSTTLRDIGVDRKRAMREIAHKEVDPTRCSRVPHVTIQEPTMPVFIPPSPRLPALDITSTLTPQRPTADAKWNLCMKRWREHCRIKRHDLAASMAPFVWSASVVKSVELGCLTLTKEEFTHWVRVTRAEEYMKDVVVPFADGADHPAVAARMPRPKPSAPIKPEARTSATPSPASPPEPPKSPEVPVSAAPSSSFSAERMALADELANLRIGVKLHQKQWAPLLGMLPIRVSLIERGKVDPTPEEIAAWRAAEHDLRTRVTARKGRALRQPRTGLIPTPHLLLPTSAPVASETPAPSPAATSSDAIVFKRTLAPAALAQIATREDGIQLLTRMLQNPRLSDAEVVEFTTQGCDALARILLG